MTCIVGIEHNGTVTIGGDSAAVDGDDMTVCRTPKVFTVGPYLIGYCESFRMGQLVQHRLKVPEQRCDDPLEHLATVFVDRLRELLHKGGVAKTSADEENQPGALLVGYRGRLYSVESDYAVIASAHNYAALGCGSAYALGSLATSTGLPADRVTAALAAAAKHSTGVTGPFTILAN